MSRRVLAFVVATAALAGCGVSAEQRARAASSDDVPFDLLDPESAPVTPSASTTVTEAVALCFVLGNKLTIVSVQLDSPVELSAALDALTDPPPAPPSLSSALANPALVRRVRLAGGIARVDLRDAVSELAGDQQLLLVAQVVCTLTGRPGVGQVAFTLEGSPIAVPRGDGSLSTDAVSRDDYAALLE